MSSLIGVASIRLVNLLTFSIVLLFFAVVILFATLALMRVVNARREMADKARKERVRPLVLDLLTSETLPDDAAWKFEHFVAAKDRRALDEVLLENARIVKGPEKDLLTGVFERLGFVDEDIARITRGRALGQAEAAFHLGTMGSPRAVPYLLDALASSNNTVVFSSLDALSRIGTHDAIDGVMDYISDGHSLPPSRVTEVLMESRREFAPLILEKLRRGDARGDLELMLIETEGAIRDREAVPLLLSYLDDKGREPIARATAARSLGWMGGWRSCDSLIEAMSDGSPEVRAEAAEALGRLSCQAAIPALGIAVRDPILQVRVNAAFALTKLSDKGIRELEKCLGTSDEYGCEVAAEALGTAAVRRGESHGAEHR